MTTEERISAIAADRDAWVEKCHELEATFVASESQLREAVKALRDAQMALSRVTDEHPTADILCEDGFTMSFHKGSVIHSLLLGAIKSADAILALHPET